MVKKTCVLILSMNLCLLPVFTQRMEKSEKKCGYSKVNLSIKTVNLDKGKKSKNPVLKKNYDRFDYDEAGRITKVISKDKGIIKISYDAYGRLKRKNRSNLESKYYYYDKLGRNTKIVYESKKNKDSVGFKYSTPAESYMLGYLTEKIEKNEHSFYKFEGRRFLEEKKIIRDKEFTVNYQYNEKGLLSEIHYPSGLIVSYEYNDKNKIEKVFVVKNKIKSEVLKYLKEKDSTTIQYGNGLSTKFNIDKEKRTLSMKTGNILDMEFKFNDKGLIERVKDKKVLRNKKDFYYDQNERLITAYGPWGKISYRYDSMDNLTKKIEKDCKYELTYDKKSSKIKELKENGEKVKVSYDKLGRMIQYGEMSFEYNTRGRLEKILKDNKVQVELHYNYKNQRVYEKNENEEFYYIYDNQDRILAKYDNQGKLLKEYIYNKEIPLGFIKDNTLYYYHYDLMNFPLMISNESGKIVREVQYKPYGEIVYAKGEFDDSLRFPGQYEIIDTNLYYNLNRIYTPVLTRYLDPDPIINDNNIYQYGISNPIKYNDIKGKAEKFKYWNDMGPIKLIKGSIFILISAINFGGIYKSECSTNCPGKYNGYYARVVTADYVQARFECRLLDLKTKLRDFSWKDFFKWLSKIPSGLSFEIEFESIDEIFNYPTKKEFEFNKGYVEIRINLKNKKFSAKVGNLKTNKMKCTSTFNIPNYADFIIKGKLLWAKGHYDCCVEYY